MIVNKLMIASILILSIISVTKYNRSNRSNKLTKKDILKLDKSTSVTDIVNNTVNDKQTQTTVTLDKNENFLIKEIYNNNNYKWFDIID